MDVKNEEVAPYDPTEVVYIEEDSAFTYTHRSKLFRPAGDELRPYIKAVPIPKWQRVMIVELRWNAEYANGKRTQGLRLYREVTLPYNVWIGRNVRGIYEQLFITRYKMK